MLVSQHMFVKPYMMMSACHVFDEDAKLCRDPQMVREVNKKKSIEWNFFAREMKENKKRRQKSLSFLIPDNVDILFVMLSYYYCYIDQ